MGFKNRSLAFEINTTLSILLQAPTPNVYCILTSPLLYFQEPCTKWYWVEKKRLEKMKEVCIGFVH